MRRDGHGQDGRLLVPILQRLSSAPGPAATHALVLAPTRELAVQIEDAIQGLLYHTTLTSAAVYGGVPMDPQERALRAGVHIIVATPGRLMDHMRSNVPDFSQLEVLVLDEADRMMDMGFWPDVRRIVEALPREKRQTLLFSATLPDDVIKLAAEFLRDPKYIEIGRAGGPARTITHTVEAVESKEKPQWLARFLKKAEGPTAGVRAHQARRRPPGAAVVGARRARGAARRSLAGAAHAGGRGFRSGRHKVLVATDIAARGLDIDGITHVVNYECRLRPRPTCTAWAARAS